MIVLSEGKNKTKILGYHEYVIFFDGFLEVKRFFLIPSGIPFFVPFPISTVIFDWQIKFIMVYSTKK